MKHLGHFVGLISIFLIVLACEENPNTLPDGDVSEQVEADIENEGDETSLDIDEGGCDLLSPRECNSSRSDEGFHCRSFQGMPVSPEDTCIEPIQHISCQKSRTDCPAFDASEGTTCAVSPSGVCWCRLYGCLPADWIKADGSGNGPCNHAIQTGLANMPSCATFSCSTHNDAASCEADVLCGIWIETNRLDIGRRCAYSDGECLPFFAGYVESDFPSSFALLDPQGRCNRGFRDIVFRDGEGVIPGWTRCDPPTRDLTETEKATCDVCIDAAQSYNASEWPACSSLDGDMEKKAVKPSPPHEYNPSPP